MPARLVLEDSTVYEGESFGSPLTGVGEVVFNTSLTGYQEIATDPSYRFQIVVMTYPHIGNYGVESDVEQSAAPQVAGFVVRDIIDEPSSAHSQGSLSDYFERHRIPAISGIDTRALTRKIRTEGAMRGLITADASRSLDSLVAEVRYKDVVPYTGKHFLEVQERGGPRGRAACNRAANASTPSLLNPMRLISACERSRRKRRGRGLPDWGRGVTVPTSI